MLRNLGVGVLLAPVPGVPLLRGYSIGVAAAPASSLPCSQCVFIIKDRRCSMTIACLLASTIVEVGRVCAVRAVCCHIRQRFNECAFAAPRCVPGVYHRL